MAARQRSNCSYVSRLEQEYLEGKAFKDIPGPTRWQMMCATWWGGEFHGIGIDKMMNKCRQRYGDIYRLPGPLGKPFNVVTYNPSDFAKVFRTEGLYPIRPGMDLFLHYRSQRRKDFYSKLHETLASSGPGWSTFRSAINPILMHPKNVKVYLDPIQEISSEFIDYVRSIRDPRSLEMPATFMDVLNHLIYETLVRVILNKRLHLMNSNKTLPEGKRLFDGLETIQQAIYNLNIKPSMYRYFKTPNYRRFEAAMDDVYDITYNYVMEAAESFANDYSDSSIREDNQSVLEHLLQIDEKFACIAAMDMLIASVGATVLAAAMLCLANNPEKQQRLRQEILEEVGSTASFNIENTKNLQYLRACIKETLRLYPVIIGNMRTIQKSINLSGYQIPRGTNVYMNSNLLLTDSRYFEQPYEFQPERWLRQNSNEQSTMTLPVQCSSAYNSFIYLPFGFGPRFCLGKRLIDMELEVNLANLLRNFHIEFNYPSDDAFHFQFINIPKIPLKFKLIDIHSK